VYIAYYDESGDDGYPQYSSPLFVLSACYLHHLNWKDCYEALHEFRRELKAEYNLPVRVELHWRQFLLNKKPYREFGISDRDRVRIAERYCEVLAQLNLRFINVCINKPKAKAPLEVLDTAFKFSIQRIENDLAPTLNPNNRFMIITDYGRVGKMRKTSRSIQRYNYIPSKFGPNSYRREIQTLIEDPLPKDSKESHFIQACDLVALIVYFQCLLRLEAGSLRCRMPAELDQAKLEKLLDTLLPSLNEKAAADDKWGIRIRPK